MEIASDLKLNEKARQQWQTSLELMRSALCSLTSELDKKKLARFKNII